MAYEMLAEVFEELKGVFYGIISGSFRKSFGYMAVFIDTEGNHVALHAQS